MKQLKKRINECETQIELKKKLIVQEYQALAKQTTKNLTSPITLGGAFVIGLLGAYLILPNKKRTSVKAKTSNNHPIAKVAFDASFWLTLIRIVERLL